MSSEASLESALQKLRNRPLGGVPLLHNTEADALLAEVARLEQGWNAARAREHEWHEAFVALDRKHIAAAMSADAARAREQRLASALQVALDCRGSYQGTVSEYGGYPAICPSCTDIARAALADQPAADEARA